MFVLGTAGHIDHGKSALVQALTGVDPDRLREEKERGMTIDLGFAWLKLPSGQEIGIVDVPGHEKFIKNMLAGVGGIDLAMLVVAANEGVMPQTREHLAIIDLLDINRGVVALTKMDLVDKDMLELVRMDIEEVLAPTTLAKAPIVPVSAITGEGIPQLLAMIDKLLAGTQPRKDIGRPRLPIDRIFTISGSGTIVTGTLIDSSLSVGQEVEIVPPGLKSRIRGLQTHKTKEDTATPGSRVAANLVGVATTDIARGQVVTMPGWLEPTTMVSVHLRLISDLERPLANNTIVSFHTGAAETMAKVKMLEGDRIEPGQSAYAQLSLRDPVAVVKDDHFIIRSTMDTLGGGKIVDPHASRLKRNRPGVIETLKVKEEGSAEDKLFALIEQKQPIELPALLSQSDMPDTDVWSALETLEEESKVTTLGQGDQRLIYAASGWGQIKSQATESVADFHRRFPTRPGMIKADLSSRLKFGKYAPQAWQRLAEDKVLVEEGLNVRLPSFEIKLNPAQEAKVNAFLKSLADNPYAPPGDQIPEPDLLNVLIEQGKVVKVSDGVVFSSEAYAQMVEKVREYTKANGKITLAEVRDLFKTSRKFAQALMEHLDEKKITRRVGDERVLI